MHADIIPVGADTMWLPVLSTNTPPTFGAFLDSFLDCWLCLLKGLCPLVFSFLPPLKAIFVLLSLLNSSSQTLFSPSASCPSFSTSCSSTFVSQCHFRCHRTGRAPEIHLERQWALARKMPCKPVNATNWDPEKKGWQKTRWEMVVEWSWIHHDQKFVVRREGRGRGRSGKREEGEVREKVARKLTEK